MVKNFKKFLSLALAIALLLSSGLGGQKLDVLAKDKHTFTDVSAKHEFYDYVTYLSKEGITTGFTQGSKAGTFGVREQLTRRHAAMFITRALGYKDEELTYNGAFKDVKAGDSGAGNIQKAFDLGLIKGYENKDGSSSYRPEQPLRRNQFSKIAALAYNLEADANKEVTLPDIKASSEFTYIKALLDNGIVTGDTNAGKFFPNNVVTRGHVSKFIYNAHHQDLVIDKAVNTKLTKFYNNVKVTANNITVDLDQNTVENLTVSGNNTTIKNGTVVNINVSKEVENVVFEDILDMGHGEHTFAGGGAQSIVIKGLTVLNGVIYITSETPIQLRAEDLAAVVGFTGKVVVDTPAQITITAGVKEIEVKQENKNINIKADVEKITALANTDITFDAAVKVPTLEKAPGVTANAKDSAGKVEDFKENEILVPTVPVVPTPTPPSGAPAPYDKKLSEINEFERSSNDKTGVFEVDEKTWKRMRKIIENSESEFGYNLRASGYNELGVKDEDINARKEAIARDVARSKPEEGYTKETFKQSVEFAIKNRSNFAIAMDYLNNYKDEAKDLDIDKVVLNVLDSLKGIYTQQSIVQDILTVNGVFIKDMLNDFSHNEKLYPGLNTTWDNYGTMSENFKIAVHTELIKKKDYGGYKQILEVFVKSTSDQMRKYNDDEGVRGLDTLDTKYADKEKAVAAIKAVATNGTLSDTTIEWNGTVATVKLNEGTVDLAFTDITEITNKYVNSVIATGPVLVEYDAKRGNKASGWIEFKNWDMNALESLELSIFKDESAEPLATATREIPIVGTGKATSGSLYTKATKTSSWSMDNTISGELGDVIFDKIVWTVIVEGKEYSFTFVKDDWEQAQKERDDIVIKWFGISSVEKHYGLEKPYETREEAGNALRSSTEYGTLDNTTITWDGMVATVTLNSEEELDFTFTDITEVKSERVSRALDNFNACVTAGKYSGSWNRLITAVHYYNTSAEDVIDRTAYNTAFNGITEIDMKDKSESSFDISTGVLVPFKNIKTLDLSKTGIKEIGGLVGLTNLVTLDLSNNQITDSGEIGALASLTELLTLDLSNNKTTDIAALVDLTKLKTLDISDNIGIVNISPLVLLAQNKNMSLISVDVTGTGVVDKQGKAIDTTSITGEVKGWLDTIASKNITLTGYNSED